MLMSNEPSRAKSSFERYCRHVHGLHDVVRVTKPTKSGGKYGHLWVLQLTEQCRRVCFKTALSGRPLSCLLCKTLLA